MELPRNRLTYLAAVAAVLLFVAGAVGFLLFTEKPQSVVTDELAIPLPINTPDSNEEFSLKPLQQQADGIFSDTSFSLHSSIQLTAERIQEALQFTPQLAYAIEEKNEYEYIIQPQSPLPDGEVITVELRTSEMDGTKYSWAYQVRESFRAVSTLPRHQATGVPVDTGIEIEFSHSDLDLINSFFSISPAVDGRFEYHRKTVVFIPNAPLATETLYTIHVSKAYSNTASNEALKDDVVFQFETRATDSPRGSEPGITRVNQITNETSSKEPGYFLVSGQGLGSMPDVGIHIYQLDADQYRQAFEEYTTLPGWCNYTRSNWKLDTAQLTLYAEQRVELQDLGNSYQYAVHTPGTLEVGRYYVEFDSQAGKPVAALLQVSDISAYLTTSASTTVAWVHDALTGDPAVGAAASLSDGTLLGKTDSKGIVQVTTPAALMNSTERQTVTIDYSNRQLLIPLSGNALGDFVDYYYDNDRDSIDPFWSYLYLDQPFYKPTDTINYWGVLDPRDGYELGETTLSIYDSAWSEDPVSVYRQTIQFGQFNTFEGAVELKGLTPGDYHAVIENNGKKIFSKYFNVLTYQKPAYQIDVSPALIGVINGDEVSHTIKATFFDGTPVAQTNFEIEDQTMRTDENGEIRYTKRSEKRNCSTHSYRCTDNLQINPTEGEEGQISGNASVIVFAANRLIEATVEHNNNTTAQLTGTLSAVDLVGYNAGQYQRWEMPLGETLGNQSVDVTVTRKWSTREQSGTRYDFLQKQNMPKYTYTAHEEVIQRTSVITKNDGTFDYSFALPATDSWYQITLSAMDENGRTTTITRGISGVDYGTEYHYDAVYLEFENSTEGNSTNTQYSVGDQVAVRMLYGADAPAADVQSFLFMQAQNGIQEIFQTTEPQYSFTFADEDIPNVILQGVWYDGRSYWPTNSSFGAFQTGLTASFKEEDKALNIETAFNQQTYKPGDTVILDVQVSRPDGSASGAVVNINLIDEAIYEMLPTGGMGWEANYQASFTSVLYDDVTAGMLSSYATHQDQLVLADAEGGGGWGTRTDFPDKAFFKTVVTDSTGHAQVQFTLPDSITSWRVNVHAIDNERYAANVFSNLVVTQPFFVTAVLNDSYLVGDQPIVKVRAFGDALEANTPVTVTVTANTAGLPEQQFQTVGSEAVEVTLPVLPIGTHELTFTAASGDLGDTIIRQIQVKPSFISITDSEKATIQPGWYPDIQSERSTKLVFADHYKTQAFRRLLNYVYSYGDRADNQAARQIAIQLMNEYFGQSYSANELVPTNYQNAETGGIGILPYSDADLTVSSHLAASRLASQFDTVLLGQYFYAILNDSEETNLRRAQALYGLAALHQPVLNEINTLLQNDYLTITEQLYLALGLAVLGDFGGADSVYAEVVNHYGRQAEDYWYINFGEDEPEQLENTLLAGYIATILQKPEADAFHSYVLRNSPPEILLDLISVNILERRLTFLPDSTATMTYQHNGESVHVSFEAGKTHSVILLPNDTFSVDAVEGDVEAIVYSEKPPSDDDVRTSDLVSVARSYETTTFQEEDLVKVTINTSLNAALPDYDQRYQVTDMIPAGMRLVTSLQGHSDYNSSTGQKRPYYIDGQRISFCVSKHDTSFFYYLRPIQKGTFTVEAPLIQSYYFPAMRNAGERTTVRIE